MDSSLESGTVQIWYTRPELIGDVELFSAYRRLLSSEERAREERFRFPKDRLIYLTTQALLRISLSRVVRRHPAEWQFVRNEFGRPELRPSRDTPPIDFNVSHTNGLTACVLAWNKPSGIDVEDLRREFDPVELADRFFSPAEANDVRRCPARKRKERFLSYWTLKESYVKARGMGLQLPLDSFSFQLPRERAATINFTDELGNRSKNWQFAQFYPTTAHVLAVCIACATGPDLSIQLRETIPLLD